jgi:exonuclease VII large subunit
LIKDFNGYEKDLITEFENVLEKQRYLLESFMTKLFKSFNYMYNFFDNFKHIIKNHLLRIEYSIKERKQLIKDSFDKITGKLEENIGEYKKLLENFDNNLKLLDPKRLLKLGYSIVKNQGMILKSKKQVKVDDELEIIVVDGTINTKINKIN